MPATVVPINDGRQQRRRKYVRTSTACPVRLVKRGATGLVFRNTIDHCFDLGTERGIAVAGDFNGDGVDTVAIFRDGHWTIDANGDGQMNDGDIEQDFGQADDRPIAGDFDGDGVDEIGVYRDGNWLISTDATGAQKITEFQLGGPGASHPSSAIGMAMALITPPSTTTFRRSTPCR